MVNLMKEKKHYAFINVRPESTLEYWYKAKYYVDEILTPLLQEQEYQAVDYFVKSYAFKEIAELGILTNIDFSEYVINWLVPAALEKEKYTTNSNFTSDTFFFNYARHVYLNKEASMILIQWFTVYAHERDLTSVAYKKYNLNETPFFSRFDDEYDSFLKSWINAKTNSSELFGEYVNLWVERDSAVKLGEEGLPRYFKKSWESRTVKYHQKTDEFYTWLSDAYYRLDDEFVAKYLNDFTLFTMAYNASVSPEVRERARYDYLKTNTRPGQTLLVVLRAGLLNDTEQYLNDFPGREIQIVNTMIANFTPLEPWMVEISQDLGRAKEAVFHDELYSKTFNSYLKLENINSMMDKKYIARIKEEARLAIGVTDDMYAPEKWIHSILEASI